MNRGTWLNNLHNQLVLIAEECKALLLAVLEGPIGVNVKVGVNTLADSNLYSTVGIGVEDFDVVNLLVNDYIDYIEHGRSPGSYPPPNVIAQWCQRKGIPSDNNTVFLICRSIYENGIPARPVFEGKGGVWELIDKHWNTFADMLFNTITEYLDENERLR